MFKNRTILELEVKGRVYRVECAFESSYEELAYAISLLHQMVMNKYESLRLEQEKQQQEIPQVDQCNNIE